MAGVEMQADRAIAGAKADAVLAPVQSSIKIFARVRPPRPRSNLHSTPGRYWVDVGEEQGLENNKLGFLVPKDEAQGLVNNQKESFDFKFDYVFDVNATQDEIFDKVGKEVVQNVLDGFNGTIFAYGQTGSGKTFTITGGPERYADRGLIPRSIQYIFNEAKNRGYQYDIAVSYLEIYNEAGYDLLDSSRDAKKLEDLPRVQLFEDSEERVHLRNLSHIAVVNEEEALNLLFVGDTNRMIAETPSNPSSSRSHCMFIISVTSKKEGDPMVRRSKLHLVDLAGSERVSRTQIGGNLLKEARHINLSLHYLEQVIVALHEKAKGKRTHIPYRNSMMTSVLRDSLGGNCKTTMISTIATEDELIDESLSTCRFAQRVALISNNVFVNEEMDPYLLIAKLKNEIAQLRAELALMRDEGAEGSEDLPEYELAKVVKAVDSYINENNPDSMLIFGDSRKVIHAFKVLKSYLQKNRPSITESTSPGSFESTTTSEVVDSNDQTVTSLRRLVAQRDNEINILLGLVNQFKEKYGDISHISASQNGFAGHNTEESLSSAVPKPERVKRMKTKPPVAVPVLTADKAKAFEIFKEGYPSSGWIENQKLLLKEKYQQARLLGEQANSLRSEIKSKKDQLNLMREENSDHNIEEDLRGVVSGLVKRYKDSYQQLKELKQEIDHLQHLLEQARHRLTRDFEHWYVTVYFAVDAVPRDRSQSAQTDDISLCSSTPTLVMSPQMPLGSRLDSGTDMNYLNADNPAIEHKVYTYGGALTASRNNFVELRLETLPAETIQQTTTEVSAGQIMNLDCQRKQKGLWDTMGLSANVAQPMIFKAQNKPR
ncbi:kinesin-like protein KIF6-like protein [Cladochytrium replicatum]|nr:kinesin-like protein KIF6-like protein [Cladochytrium replicatum]